MNRGKITKRNMTVVVIAENGKHITHHLRFVETKSLDCCSPCYFKNARPCPGSCTDWLLNFQFRQSLGYWTHMRGK